MSARPYRPNPHSPEGKHYIALQERVKKLTSENRRLKETIQAIRKECSCSARNFTFIDHV